MARSRTLLAALAALLLLVPLAATVPAQAADTDGPAAHDDDLDHGHGHEHGEVDSHLRGWRDLGDGTVVVHHLVGIGEPEPAQLTAEEDAQLTASTEGTVTGPGYVRKTGIERVDTDLLYEFDDSVPAGIITDSGTAEGFIEAYTGTSITTGGAPGCDDENVAIPNDWNACLNSLAIGDVATFVNSVSPCGDPGEGFVILGCASTRYFTSGPDEGTSVGGLVVYAPSVPGSSLQTEVVLHELGHIIGLGHYDAGYRGLVQVMASTATVAKSEYELGDINGLVSLANGWTSRSPIGAITSASDAGGAIDVGGWAFDSGAADVPVPVSFTIDGSPAGSVDTTPEAPFVASGSADPALLDFSTTIASPTGTVELCATATNVGPEGADASLGCTNVTVAATTGSISGVVTGDDGPAEGIEVTLYPGYTSGALAATTTAGDGSYGFADVTAGDYRLRFRDLSGPYPTEWWSDQPDAATANIVTVTGGADATADATISAVGRIEGTVTDGTGPVAGIDVGLYPGTTSGRLATATTAADGTYAFEDLPPGSYRLRFADPVGGVYGTEWWTDALNAFEADKAWVQTEATTVADAEVAEPGTLAGQVLERTYPGTTPLAGATVRIYRASGGTIAIATTAGDGTFTVEGLPPGDYLLRLSATGYATEWYADAVNARADAAITVPVTANATTNLADGGDLPPPVLSSEATPELSGIVTDATTDLPIAGATVRLYHPGGFITSTTTTAAGTYTFNGVLTPGTDYALKLHAAGYETEWHHDAPTYPGATLLPFDGDTPITADPDLTPTT